MSSNQYEAVIGIETHIQLKTKSKIFCADATNFEASDNENASAISAGMPGTLPVLNKEVVEMAIRTGLALNCHIRKDSVFSRKNYFYPDLPKGYQISQYDKPICENGFVEIWLNGKHQKVSITRAHLEEDAGKSTHFGDYTLINLNRAGVPLLEVVSGPDMHTAQEAAEYGRTIRQIVRYLDVCDGNLEEGSLRCDVNISVRKKGQQTLGTKVEIKNINSFRFIEKAVEYEFERQVDAVESGQKIIQETRLYDPDKNRTFSMRTKEDAEDYRYFPDPDLLPVILTDEKISSHKKNLPEMPSVKMQRFMSQLELGESDALFLTSEKNIADYFENVFLESNNAKSSANWVTTELMRELNSRNVKIEDSPVEAKRLGQLIQLIDKKTISGKIAKTLLIEMWTNSKGPEEIAKEKNLTALNDSSQVEKIVQQVIDDNPDQAAEYRSGKTKIIGFFVGAVMKASRGQAQPDLVNQLLLEKLKGP